MSGKRSQHDLTAWRKLREKRKALGRASGEGCAFCHGRLGPIMYTLSGREPLGPTVDHVVPLALGGDLLPRLEDLAMSHRVCSQRQGGMVQAAMAGPKRRRARDPEGEPPAIW